jgi:drug/metabolite transporter (DMT)-like permease
VLNNAALSKRRIGLVCGVLSGASYGVMAFLIHLLAGKLPAWEITFVRAIGAVAVLLPLIAKQGLNWFRRISGLLWIRSLAGATSLFCLAWNLQHTSVGFANTLFNLAPIFVVLSGSVAGQEKLQFGRFISVALVVLASAIFWHGSRTGISAMVWLVGLTGMLAASIAYAMLKSLPRSWSSIDITWCMNLATLPVALIFKSGPWIAPHHNVSWILFAICLLSLLGNALVNISFRRVELSTATALVPSSIIWGVLLDMMEGSFPPLQGALGCLLYLGATIRLAIQRSAEQIGPASQAGVATGGVSSLRNCQALSTDLPIAPK